MKIGCQHDLVTLLGQTDNAGSSQRGIAMNIRSGVAAAHIALVFLLGAGIAAEAAEVRVLASYGARDVIQEIAPRFEAATGHNLAIRLQTPRVIQKTIQDGAAADVVIAAGVDLAEGQMLPASVTPVARGILGVAVRKDAPKPDISSVDAVKRALLGAKSIAYSGGPAAVNFVKTFNSWNTEESQRKIIIGGPPPGRVEDLVASGEAEIGVHVLSILLAFPGIQTIGALPEELQSATVTSAAIMSGAKDTSAAKALIDFLRTPEAVAVIKAKGMAPAMP